MFFGKLSIDDLTYDLYVWNMWKLCTGPLKDFCSSATSRLWFKLTISLPFFLHPSVQRLCLGCLPAGCLCRTSAYSMSHPFIALWDIQEENFKGKLPTCYNVASTNQERVQPPASARTASGGNFSAFSEYEDSWVKLLYQLKMHSAHLKLSDPRVTQQVSNTDAVTIRW